MVRGSPVFLVMSKNNSPTTTPDETTATILRDQGMALALQHTSAHYKSMAYDMILALAQAFEPFTVEDVRSRIGDPPGHGCVMGALVSGALKRGVTRSVGFVRAERPSSHRGHLQVFCGA
jgi:hypothetical protein